jgi:hypothetical protein
MMTRGRLALLRALGAGVVAVVAAHARGLKPPATTARFFGPKLLSLAATRLVPHP